MSHKSLPEIYQIEVTNRCNLKCPMCLRTTDMVRDADLLDPQLLRTMHARGDFAGSHYVELQMAGEPTLHPELLGIIRYLRDTVGVMVGLSTHGLLMGRRAGVVDALLELDDLTISVDSVVPEVYAKMRYPAQLPMLERALACFFEALKVRKATGAHVPFVELQVVATPLVEGSGDHAALQRFVDANGWAPHCAVRVVNDCFTEMQGRRHRGENKRSAQMCINPFSSVSVAHNGDVVSCCYIFDPKRSEINYYGNLYDNSLREIWESERVAAMRRSHMAQKLEGACASCYLYSPTLIHQNILTRHVQFTRTRKQLPVLP